MPRAAAKPSTPGTAEQMSVLLVSAMSFVAPERGEAMILKWISRDVHALSVQRQEAMMADAIQLAADLMFSQPSASGATAFDRLAKSRGGAPASQMSALAALCQSRFRLLRVEDAAPPGEIRLRDVLSGEMLHTPRADSPPIAGGMTLFARVAVLGDGLCCLPSAVTPLDPAAFAVASGHAAAGAPGVAANVRWAEAVYAHVVRHGTMDVPGLNRLSDEDADGEEDLLYALAKAWADIGDGSPDSELVQRTRQLADLPSILDVLISATSARAAAHGDMADAFERMLLVQLETVQRRERSSSGKLSLDAVAQAVEAAIGAGRLPPAAPALFKTLRQRLGGASGTGPAGDPALERLMQRIQGLRAKTVAHGCTEQEALAAAEKVAELLDRYGLSLGELDFRAQPCEGIGIQTDRRRAAPIDGCVPGIAAFFDCRVWLEQAKGAALRYVFFGLRGDVAAAQYLYEMVERAFETETAAFRAGHVYAQMAGERRTATNSFQIGLAHGISGKLDSMRGARNAAQRSQSGRDLVPVKAAMVDEEMEKLGLALKRRETGRGKRVLTDAFTAGQEAGERFEVTTGITRAA